jgi:hypothetical protein
VGKNRFLECLKNTAFWLYMMGSMDMAARVLNRAAKKIMPVGVEVGLNGSFG